MPNKAFCKGLLCRKFQRIYKCSECKVYLCSICVVSDEGKNKRLLCVNCYIDICIDEIMTFYIKDKIKEKQIDKLKNPVIN